MQESEAGIIEKAYKSRLRDKLLGITFRCIQRGDDSTPIEYFATYNNPYLTVVNGSENKVVMHADIGDITHKGKLQLVDNPIVVDVYHVAEKTHIVCITSIRQSLVWPTHKNSSMSLKGHTFRDTRERLMGIPLMAATNYRLLSYVNSDLWFPTDHVDRIFLIHYGACREMLQFGFSNNRRIGILDIMTKSERDLDRKIFDTQADEYLDIHSEWSYNGEIRLPDINICQHGEFVCRDLDKRKHELYELRVIRDIEVEILKDGKQTVYKGRVDLRKNEKFGEISSINAPYTLFNGCCRFDCTLYKEVETELLGNTWKSEIERDDYGICSGRGL
jgi:hypothetical protein